VISTYGQAQNNLSCLGGNNSQQHLNKMLCTGLYAHSISFHSEIISPNTAQFAICK